MENQERFSVMVVDDDVVSAFLTTCLLDESNLFNHPLIFFNVESALQYVQENCLDLVPTKRLPIPQILLIDVNLPGKDGFDLVDELWKLCPDLKQRTTLCFLSCSDYPSDKKKADEMGVDCYFEKPLNDRHFQLLKEVANNKGMLIA